MAAHPVDIHVGRRLRSRRTILGMSQEEIGQSVGVTFQQIQKYERGLNRIGSSRLYEFSCILGVGISYFFEDYHNPQLNDNDEVNSLQEEENAFEYEKLNNKEILNLVRSYYGIPDPAVRKKILSLIKTLSSEEVTDKTTVKLG